MQIDSILIWGSSQSAAIDTIDDLSKYLWLAQHRIVIEVRFHEFHPFLSEDACLFNYDTRAGFLDLDYIPYKCTELWTSSSSRPLQSSFDFADPGCCPLVADTIVSRSHRQCFLTTDTSAVTMR